MARTKGHTRATARKWDANGRFSSKATADTTDRIGNDYFRFFDLPVELRIKVYEYTCFGGIVRIAERKCQYCDQTDHPDQRFTIAKYLCGRGCFRHQLVINNTQSGYVLLRASHTFREEVMPVFFRLTAFSTHIKGSAAGKNIIDTLRPGNLHKAFPVSFLQKIEILELGSGRMFAHGVAALMPSLKTVELISGGLSAKLGTFGTLASIFNPAKGLHCQKSILRAYHKSMLTIGTAVWLDDPNRNFKVFVNFPDITEQSCLEMVRFDWDDEKFADFNLDAAMA